MAGSVNKVILVGNVGRDPEIRNFQSGDKVCNLSVATSDSWTDKSTGERKEKTEWHRVTIRNQKIIGVVERYVQKGAKVYVEGQIETRKYTDKDGAEKYSTEIVVGPFRGELTMLDNKSGGGSAGSFGASDAGASYMEESSSRPALGASPAKAGSFDDDIPF